MSESASETEFSCSDVYCRGVGVDDGSDGVDVEDEAVEEEEGTGVAVGLGVARPSFKAYAPPPAPPPNRSEATTPAEIPSNQRWAHCGLLRIGASGPLMCRRYQRNTRFATRTTTIATPTAIPRRALITPPPAEELVRSSFAAAATRAMRRRQIEWTAGHPAHLAGPAQTTPLEQVRHPPPLSGHARPARVQVQP
jgi:hypothetical protein